MLKLVDLNDTRIVLAFIIMMITGMSGKIHCVEFVLLKLQKTFLFPTESNVEKRIMKQYSFSI